MAWTAPSTAVTGTVLTAATWNAQVRDNMLWLGGGNFAAYTPTVKFGATAATISNDSRYTRIGNLITAVVQFRLTNLNGGTGSLTITRPVAGRMSTITNNYTASLGVYDLYDASAAAIYSGTVTAATSDGTDVTLRTSASPTVAVTNTAPITFAAGAAGTGDEIYCTFTYEVP